MIVIFVHTKQKQLCYLKDKEAELAIAQSEASELREGFLQLRR